MARRKFSSSSSSLSASIDQARKFFTSQVSLKKKKRINFSRLPLPTPLIGLPHPGRFCYGLVYSGQNVSTSKMESWLCPFSSSTTTNWLFFSFSPRLKNEAHFFCLCSRAFSLSLSQNSTRHHRNEGRKKNLFPTMFLAPAESFSPGGNFGRPLFLADFLHVPFMALCMCQLYKCFVHELDLYGSVSLTCCSEKKSLANCIPQLDGCILGGKSWGFLRQHFIDAKRVPKYGSGCGPGKTAALTFL